jgi:hypothetical protein
MAATIYRDGPLANIRGDRISKPPVDEPTSVRIVGSDPVQIELIAGIQGIVSDSKAAIIAMNQTAAEMLVLSQRTASLYGKSTDAAAQTVALDRGVLTETVSESVKAATETILRDRQEREAKQALSVAQTSQEAKDEQDPTKAPGGFPGKAQTPPVAPGPFTPVQPDQVQQTTEEMLQGAEVAEDTQVAEDQVSNYEKYQQGLSLGQIKQTVAKEMGERVSSFQFGPQLVEDEIVSGGFRHVTDTGEIGAPADPDEVAGFTRNQKLLGGAKNILSKVAGGESVAESVLNKLPASIGKIAGPVGAAATIYTAGTGFAANQREANADWQRVLGGSNAEGFKERLESQTFKRAPDIAATLGGKQAEALYKGAAEIHGSDQYGRDQTMDFAVEAYKSMGIEISESLSIVKTYADAGEQSLVGLADSLKSVSDTAKDAGMNAEGARAMFVETTTGLVEETGMSGPGATQTAEAFTKANIAAFGPALGEQVDIAGILEDDTKIRQMATLLGKDASTFRADLAGPDGELEAARGVKALSGQYLTSVMAPAQPAINAFYESQGLRPGDSLTTAQAEELNTVVMRAGVDAETAQMALATTGVKGTNSSTAPGVAAGITSGMWDPEALVIEQQEEMKRRPRSEAELTDDLPDPTGFRTQIGKSLGIGEKADSGIAPLDYATNALRTSFGKVLHMETDPEAKQYEKYVKDTGHHDPYVKSLIETTGGADDWRFSVQDRTKDGELEQRVVTLDEALKDYGDQLQRGDVDIVGGEMAGTTVAKLVGGGDQSIDATPTERIGKGKTLKEFEKERDKEKDKEKDKEGEGRDGRVTIELKPGMKRYFDLSLDGSVYSNDIARNEGRMPDRVPPKQRNVEGG